jgi:CubicO group peptidase (beta-lactamase class C family)
MIAVSLMKLAEKGKISLEADINMYLPFKVINPNFPKNKITLLQLATHTSSIVESDHADDNSYFVIDKKASKEIFPKGSYKYYKRHLKNENTTIEEYLKSHLVITGDKFNNDIFGDYVPGTQYSYSNVASTLAAYLIEILSGQTFESFTEENIFSPLQMENTSWKHPKGENVASKYFHNGFKVPDYTLITFPSGGLQTSSYDMAKFMSEMMNGYLGKGKLLSKESYHYMFTNRLDSEKISKTQGLFWDINLEGNISHGGAEIGTTCQVIFSPKLKKAFFMMINMTVYDQEILERSYRDLLITISRYAKSLN